MINLEADECCCVCVYRADIDECSDPEYPAGCNHKCSNLPGSFHCMCEEGYVINNKINCFGKTAVSAA